MGNNAYGAIALMFEVVQKLRLRARCGRRTSHDFAGIDIVGSAGRLEALAGKGLRMLSYTRTLGDRTRRHKVSHQAAAFALLGMIGARLLASQRAVADESGVSFWLPGNYGSLAAVPLPPGWSLSTTNYYTSVSAAKSVDFQIGGGVVAGLNAHVDLEYSTVAYAFPTPVLGGEAVLSMSSIVANANTFGFRNLDGTGRRNDFGQPRAVGHRIWRPLSRRAATLEPGREQLYDLFDRRYSGRPLQLQNLANIGIGHGVIDGGGGYTYFNPQTGHELSAVIGVTYNFMNPSTNYQNGIDGHLDWAASQFLSPNFQLAPSATSTSS